MSNWIQHLTEHIPPIKLTEPKGKGWKTMRQIIAECEWGINKTRAMVMDGVKAGKIEVFGGTQLNASGIKTRQTWYKIK